jgi:hypothetical protein
VPKYEELRDFLRLWTRQFSKKPTPEKFAESLSVESLRESSFTSEGWEKVTKFRKLRQDARVRMAKRVLEEM